MPPRLRPLLGPSPHSRTGGAPQPPKSWWPPMGSRAESGALKKKNIDRYIPEFIGYGERWLLQNDPGSSEPPVEPTRAPVELPDSGLELLKASLQALPRPQKRGRRRNQKNRELLLQATRMQGGTTRERLRAVLRTSGSSAAEIEASLPGLESALWRALQSAKSAAPK